MPSIRRRLLLIVLALFAGSWGAVTVATYLEARHEVEELFDAQLAQSAGIIADLSLAEIESRGVAGARLARDRYGHKYERAVGFQIWRGDALLLRSGSAPDARFSGASGFFDERVGDTLWRVFALPVGGEGGYTVFAAESYAVRDELIANIVRDALLPLVWAMPIVAVILWVGVGRGLAPLRRVAAEVARRSPRALDPVPVQGSPAEVRPLTVALNDLLARVRRAFEKERRFTADASHELRTPLASIKTQAQVALRARSDAERRQALQMIVSGVDRSTHLVEQMLTLARLEPESLAAERTPVDLAGVAEEVIAAAAGEARARGVHLVLAACPDRGHHVSGHGPGLAVMLRNLVDNALGHAPAGSTVEVALTRESGTCRLTVTDAGPGIPSSERERVFDRFYRLPGQARFGSGLGLAIVQRIADLHQAAIRLEDGPGGRGLRVTVEFACAGGHPPSPA